MNVICQSGADISEALITAGRGGTVVFVGGRDVMALASQLWSTASHGMMFRGSRVAIYVGAKHLPRQAFNVWI